MKNYKYKMDKVLEYRENIEKVKVEDYAKINYKLMKEQEHLSKLQEEFEEKKKKSASDIYGMKMNFLYKEKLKAELDAQVHRVDEISEKAHTARGILIEARKDRKIMEMLKEKDHENFKKEVLAEEQKELDDLSVMRFVK
mgnify:CR=1 FL=1